jgi:hypothetical protein
MVSTTASVEVHGRHHTHQQVGMLRDIDRVGNRRAVEALVEHQVSAAGNVFPGRELAGLLAVRSRFVGIVQILPHLASAGLAIGLEQPRQFLEQIGFRTEVTEVVIAFQPGFFHCHFHGLAVIAMEGVALDDGGLEVFAAEHQVERLGDRGRAGARRSGNCNDGMLDRHGSLLV